MTIIGQLREKTTKTGKVLEGDISTLAISLNIELEPAPRSDNPKAPAYHIYSWGHSGVRVLIGAAWIKGFKRGENVGEEFLTLTIDDPSLTRGLNVAAFRNKDTGNWDITFRRRQERAA